MKRRGFLKLIGVGAAATAVAPTAVLQPSRAMQASTVGDAAKIKFEGIQVGSIIVSDAGGVVEYNTTSDTRRMSEMAPAPINDGIRQFMQQASNYRFDAD